MVPGKGETRSLVSPKGRLVAPGTRRLSGDGGPGPRETSRPSLTRVVVGPHPVPEAVWEDGEESPRRSLSLLVPCLWVVPVGGTRVGPVSRLLGVSGDGGLVESLKLFTTNSYLILVCRYDPRDPSVPSRRRGRALRERRVMPSTSTSAGSPRH